MYIFNGDLVDRGGSGYQIVFCLALFLLLDPTSTYVNRGNHESEMFGASTQPGMGYKFLFEIQDKFPTLDMSAYAGSVAEFFYALPICIRLDKNILIVHGGVPVASEPVSRPVGGSPYEMTPLKRPNDVQPYSLSSLATLHPPR